MALPYVQHDFDQANAASTSSTAVLPASPTAGNLLVCAHFSRGTSNPDPGIPAGFSSRGVVASGGFNGGKLHVGYRANIPAGLSTSFTATKHGGANNRLVVVEFGGDLFAFDTDNSNTAQTSGTPHTTSALTAKAVRTLILGIMVLGGSATAFGYGSGFTGVDDGWCTGNQGPYGITEYLVRNSAGSQSAVVTRTGGSNISWGGFVLAFTAVRATPGLKIVSVQSVNRGAFY